MPPPYPNRIMSDSGGVKAMQTNQAHIVGTVFHPTSFPSEPLIGM
jgi:hypothetical protein